MAAPQVNTFFALEVAHAIQGGRFDPSVQGNAGDAGTIFVQLPPFGANLTVPFGLWQKQDNGFTTNWAPITTSSIGISSYKQPVIAASTANIAPLGGPGLPPVIDGITLNPNDRVLLKDQTTASENGIYVLQTGPGPTYSFVRAQDASQNSEVKQGMFTWVIEGTVNHETGWILTTPNPIVLNTTPLTFVQIPIPGVVTIGPIDSQPQSANGATIVPGVSPSLVMQTFQGPEPGLVPPQVDPTLVLHGNGIWGSPISLNPVSPVGNPNAASLAGDALTLHEFDSANPGVVPASGGGAVNVLHADGTWSPSIALAPVGAAPNANAATLVGDTLNLEKFSATQPGVVPASGGNPTDVLHADGTWGPAASVAAWERETTVLAGPTASIALAHLAVHNSVIVTLEGAASPLFVGTIAGGYDVELTDAGVTTVHFSPALQAGMVAGQKVAVQYTH